MLHKSPVFFEIFSLLCACVVLYRFGGLLSPQMPFVDAAEPPPSFSHALGLASLRPAPEIPPSTQVPTPTPPTSVPVSVTYAPQAPIATISVAGIGSGEIQFKNETDYVIDTAALRATPPVFSEKTEKPYILILHTHATEAYTPTSENPYVASSDYRTTDTAKNVTAVGKRLSEKLNKRGIKTLNDATLNDYPVYSYSYKNSLTLAEQHVSNGVGTGLILDLHRDAMQSENGAWLRTACTLPDGQEAAQIMLVVGTDAIGLSNPAWRRNLTLAVHLQDTLEQLYPGITRPINIRRERFNSHVGNFQLLVEIGTNANTLEEALLSAECFAEALAQLIP